MGDKDAQEGVKKFINYRLMSYEEIPSWFVQKPRELEIQKEYGRGNRLRKQVNYSDDLTD